MELTIPPNPFGNLLKLGGLGLLLLLLILAAGKAGTTTWDKTSQDGKQVFTAVVADDEPAEMARTVTALTTLITALGYQPRILPTVSVTQLTQFALTGNDGKQANLVVLDGGYGFAKNIEDWIIMPKWDFATGPLLAELLRTSGFTNPIVLMSGAPDEYDSNIFSAKIRKGDFWRNPSGFLEVFANFFK